MKKTQKSSKGITLISLVITIIILLILAGISISALTQTGIFAKAKQAEQKSKEAQEQENAILGTYENEINTFLGTRDSMNFSGEELLKEPIIVNTTTTWQTLDLDFEIPSVEQYNYLFIEYGLYNTNKKCISQMETRILAKSTIENSKKNSSVFMLNAASGLNYSTVDIIFKSDTVLCVTGSQSSSTNRQKFAITSIQGIK